MKRALLAAGLAVLLSMMIVPKGVKKHIGFEVREREPFFIGSCFPNGCYVTDWTQLATQTLFGCILFASVSTMLPRKQ